VDTLLTIIQSVCGKVGVPKPLTVVGNVDPRAITFLELAKEELRELCRVKWWGGLTRFGTVNIVAATSQYSLPALYPDFDKLVPSTLYGSTTLLGPRGGLNPAQWADSQKYGSIYGIPGFRMVGNTLYIVPAPTVANTYAFEYKSKQRVLAADNVTYKETFLADDDAPVLDDQLLRLGIAWRYRYSKGLEYAEDFRAYQEAIEQTYAQELAHGNITIGRDRTCEDIALTNGYVPDTGYGA
jgi:hypothetical protein